jgi:hypothetical protein
MHHEYEHYMKMLKYSKLNVAKMRFTKNVNIIYEDSDLAKDWLAFTASYDPEDMPEEDDAYGIFL